MPKIRISHKEELQLIGLLTLAKRYNNIQNEIVDAVAEITGEDGSQGHSMDAVYCDYEVEKLLELLSIEVEG